MCIGDTSGQLLQVCYREVAVVASFTQAVSDIGSNVVDARLLHCTIKSAVGFLAVLQAVLLVVGCSPSL